MKEFIHNVLCLRLLGLLLLCAVACDTGYSYRPEGWISEKGGLEWSKNVNGLKFLTWGISELTESEDITPEFEITNQASVPVVVESADFVGKKIYHAQLPGGGERQWRMVPPGVMRRIALQWTFEEPAWKVLGSKPRMALKLRQGAGSTVVEIVYEKIE